MNIQELTKRVMDNKIKKGFNVTDINEEFCHLYGEISEIDEEFKKDISVKDICDELADCIIFLLSIAHISKVSLIDEIASVSINKDIINPTTPTTEAALLLLYSSTSEAYDSYLKGKDDFGMRLATIYYSIVNISNFVNYDLEKSLINKIEYNEKREYKMLPNGGYIDKAKMSEDDD